VKKAILPGTFRRNATPAIPDGRPPRHDGRETPLFLNLQTRRESVGHFLKILDLENPASREGLKKANSGRFALNQFLITGSSSQENTSGQSSRCVLYPTASRLPSAERLMQQYAS
jgi:hypothetical protein